MAKSAKKLGKSRGAAAGKKKPKKATVKSPKKKKASVAKKPTPKAKPKKAKPKKAVARKRSPPRPREPAGPTREPLVARLLEAIDLMTDLSPGSVSDVRDVPASSHTRVAWRIAVRFVQQVGTTYDDIYRTLIAWRDSRKLERLITEDRLSRIVVRYRHEEGKSGEYTLSEIGSWELVISRAVERVGVRDDRLPSLLSRYGSEGNTSYIDSLIVWFSNSTSQEINLAKEIRQQEKDSHRRRVRH